MTTSLSRHSSHHTAYQQLSLVCALVLALLLPFTPAHADAALQDLLAAAGDSSNATLSESDLQVLQALAATQKKGSRQLTSKPVVQKPGEVRFIYGASQPTVVCSLLHVCDIALEAGETVVDVKVGDSARWIIERSASGSNEGIVEHITVKPTDTGLVSNMRIYTDRRTYSLDLKSSATDFMPSIAFSYPEQSLQKFTAVKERLLQTAHMNSIAVPQAGGGANGLELISQLDFAYELSGDEELLPLRVFNDGRHTYVQMPEQLLQGKLPALVAVTSTSSFGSDSTTLTNYRVQGQNFIVDGVPQHLRLILGQADSSDALSADVRYSPRS